MDPKSNLKPRIRQDTLFSENKRIVDILTTLAQTVIAEHPLDCEPKRARENIRSEAIRGGKLSMTLSAVERKITQDRDCRS